MEKDGYDRAVLAASHRIPPPARRGHGGDGRMMVSGRTAKTREPGVPAEHRRLYAPVAAA